MNDLEKSMNDALNKAVGAIESVAPKAWQLMVEATRLNAAIDLCVAVLWIVAFCAISVFLRRLERRVIVFLREDYQKRYGSKMDYFEHPAPIFCLVGCAAAVLIALWIASSSAQNVARLMRPDVYTAKDLVTKVTK